MRDCFDAGAAVVNMLKLGLTPKDILTKAEKKVDPLKPDGLAQSAMTDAQKKLLMELIEDSLFVG